MGEWANHCQHLNQISEGIDPTPVWSINLSLNIVSSIRLITTLTATIATTNYRLSILLVASHSTKATVEHRPKSYCTTFPPTIVERLNYKREPSPTIDDRHLR